MEDEYSNPQEGDADFNRNDEHIQASITYLNTYFDRIFLKRALN